MESLQKKQSYFSSWLNSSSDLSNSSDSSSYSLEEIKESHYEKKQKSKPVKQNKFNQGH